MFPGIVKTALGRSHWDAQFLSHSFEFSSLGNHLMDPPFFGGQFIQSSLNVVLKFICVSPVQWFVLGWRDPQGITRSVTACDLRQ
jgi:hypothetical protein